MKHEWQTGQILFFMKEAPVSWLIELGTAPLRFLKNLFRHGRAEHYEPSHVGLVRKGEHGALKIWHSTSSRGGVSQEPLGDVLSRYKPHQVRVGLLNIYGCMEYAEGVMDDLEGTPYEELPKMALIPMDWNSEGADRLFCSEAVVVWAQRVWGNLASVGRFEWPAAKTLDLIRKGWGGPANTSPRELFHEGRKVGAFKAVRLGKMQPL